MSMMKRNDGYALSYVLVILLVLSVIAISTLPAPLRNLQSQQASIERMQEKYAAQGIMEQAVSMMEAAADSNALNDLVSNEEGALYECPGFSPVGDNAYETAVKVTHGKTVIVANIELSPNEGDGYHAKYTLYRVEVTP